MTLLLDVNHTCVFYEYKLSLLPLFPLNTTLLTAPPRVRRVRPDGEKDSHQNISGEVEM